MTRMLVPLPVPDVSTFAKRLLTELDQREALPSHLELLNLLARAAGLRNYQTLRAAAGAQPKTAAAVPPAAPPIAPPAVSSSAPAALSATARKALLQFDAHGRLVRLPNKLSVQQMAAWALWTRFTVRRKYTEKEVNQILNAHHTFGDQATLRRELVNMKLLGRKSDCSEYWKEPRRPDAEVQSFLTTWRANLK